MNIYGIGVDIVRVDRVRAVYRRFPSRFPEKILSGAELEAFPSAGDAVAFLSRRFAAKEAVSKALGTGFAWGVSPRDIEVTSNDRGRPGADLLPAARRRIELPDLEFVLSIADESDYAIAYAMALRKE